MKGIPTSGVPNRALSSVALSYLSAPPTPRLVPWPGRALLGGVYPMSGKARELLTRKTSSCELDLCLAASQSQ